MVIHLGMSRTRFNCWVKKIPWRREWLTTPVFLLGEFHGQRRLAGYCPWSCKESDTMEQLTNTQKRQKAKPFSSLGLKNQGGVTFGWWYSHGRGTVPKNSGHNQMNATIGKILVRKECVRMGSLCSSTLASPAKASCWLNLNRRQKEAEKLRRWI